MNSRREFEGKNVDAAVDLACKKLKIKKSELKYDIISSGSSGIFSLIGVKKAKISVLVGQAKDDNSVASLVDEAFGVTAKKKASRKNNKSVTPPRKKTPPSSEGAKKKQKTAPVPTPKKEPEKNPSPRVLSDFYKGKSAEEIGQEVIHKILGCITDNITIDIESSDGLIVYRLTGEDSAVMIGKRGQTLEAIQYLVDKIVNKHSLERKRIQIDVEGYLEKRRENLEKMAIRMSEKVMKTGKPSTLSQMSSQDRRIIHLALKENREIRTQSVGEGYYRKLVIFPKKGRKKRAKSGS